MAVSLSSIVGFNSTFHTRCRQIPIYSNKMSASRSSSSSVSALTSVIKDPIRGKSKERSKSSLSVCSASGSDTETTDSAVGSSSTDPTQENNQIPKNVAEKLGSKTIDPENGSSSKIQSTRKRAPLTARERLRAARVLSRYTEASPKTSKPEMGSKLLDVMKESDKKAKKKPGLPEAPTNLFDDSKRGMPKAGLTFDLPGGVDILVIAFSFVFISTVMIGTTYVVWKLGAIHFNEY